MSYEDTNYNKRRTDVRFYVKSIAMGLLVIAFGYYIGRLLFGQNSLEVYVGLEQNLDNLKVEVERLKSENTALQKEYFELKNLEPE